MWCPVLRQIGWRPSWLAALSVHASLTRPYWPRPASEQWRVWWAMARSDAPRRWAWVKNQDRRLWAEWSPMMVVRAIAVWTMLFTALPANGPRIDGAESEIARLRVELCDLQRRLAEL